MKVTSEKITRIVTGHARTFTKLNSALGSTCKIIVDGHEISSKLYGYNSSRKSIIIEVSVDSVMLERVTLSRKYPEDDYVHQYKLDYSRLFHIKSKEPKRAPVDEG